MEFEYCHLAPRATRVVVEDLSKPRPLESLQLHGRYVTLMKGAGELREIFHCFVFLFILDTIVSFLKKKSKSFNVLWLPVIIT